jgi:hypothetical protein
MESAGKDLTLLGNDVFRGAPTHNGTLLKLHDNSFTTGYSSLTPHATIPAKFGFGAWYDGTLKNNAIFTVMPAGVGAEPIFAGILARSQAIASGYPAKNNQIDSYNKGTLVKDGYLVYKTAYDPVTGLEDMAYADVELGMLLCINEANGRFTFAAAAPVDFTAVGRVILINPDDESWTVKLTFLNA